MENPIEKFNRRYGNRSKVEKEPVSEKQEETNESFFNGDEKKMIKAYEYFNRKKNRGESLTEEEIKMKDEIDDHLGGLNKKPSVDLDTQVEEYIQGVKDELEEKNNERFKKIDEYFENKYPQEQSLDVTTETEIETEEGDAEEEPKKKTISNNIFNKAKIGINKIKKKVLNRAENAKEFHQDNKTLRTLEWRYGNLHARMESQSKLLTGLKKPEEIQELANEIIVIKERLKRLEERSKGLETRIKNYRERNQGLFKQLSVRSGRQWNDLKSFYDKPGSRKKILGRMLIGGAMTAGLGVIGVGAATTALSGALIGIAGGAGGYLGQGFARGIFDKLVRKDFREDMFRLRNEGLQNSKSKEDVLRYKERLDSFYKTNEASGKRSNAEVLSLRFGKEEVKKKIAGVLGSMVFSGLARMSASSIAGFFNSESIPGSPDGDILLREPSTTTGLEDVKIEPDLNLSQENIIDNAPEKITGVIDPETVNGTQESINLSREGVVLEDIYIKKGEGITHAFVRQIKASPELQKYFNLSSNPSESDLIKAAAKAAQETGYLSDTQEVRVIFDEGAGYELELNSKGLSVNEYKDINLKDGVYEGGTLSETHTSPDDFEGSDIERDREYLTKRGAVETNTSQREITGEHIEEDLTNISSSTEITDKYLGADRYKINNPTEITGEYLGDDLNKFRNTTEITGEYIGETFPEHESILEKKLRNYDDLPGVKGLGGTFISQNKLSPKFNNLKIPQEIIDLFQNKARISTFVRFDDRVLDVMGLELNDLPGRTNEGAFKMTGTNKVFSWRDIYEKANLSKVKRAIENLKG